MNELTNVIKTLFHIQTQIKVLTETLNVNFNNRQEMSKIEYPDNSVCNISFRDSVNTFLSTHHIILVNSFLDEYNHKLTAKHVGSEFEEGIIRVKNANKLFMKRINKWGGIKDFRNHIVAHNYRVNKDSLFSSETPFKSYKIPNTNSEKNLVCGILHLVCENLKRGFLGVCLHINPDETMLDNFEIQGEYVESNKELNALLKKNPLMI